MNEQGMRKLDLVVPSVMIIREKRKSYLCSLISSAFDDDTKIV